MNEGAAGKERERAPPPANRQEYGVGRADTPRPGRQNHGGDEEEDQGFEFPQRRLPGCDDRHGIGHGSGEEPYTPPVPSGGHDAYPCHLVHHRFARRDGDGSARGTGRGGRAAGPRCPVSGARGGPRSEGPRGHRRPQDRGLPRHLPRRAGRRCSHDAGVHAAFRDREPAAVRRPEHDPGDRCFRERPHRRGHGLPAGIEDAGHGRQAPPGGDQRGSAGDLVESERRVEAETGRQRPRSEAIRRREARRPHDAVRPDAPPFVPDSTGSAR